MTNETEITKSELSELPDITRGGIVTVGMFWKVPVGIDQHGKVWVDLDKLIGALNNQFTTQHQFAERQCKEMAAQASYDVGVKVGLERALNTLVRVQEDGQSHCKTHTGLSGCRNWWILAPRDSYRSQQSSRQTAR